MNDKLQMLSLTVEQLEKVALFGAPGELYLDSLKYPSKYQNIGKN